MYGELTFIFGRYFCFQYDVFKKNFRNRHGVHSRLAWWRRFQVPFQCFIYTQRKSFRANTAVVAALSLALSRQSIGRLRVYGVRYCPLLRLDPIKCVTILLERASNYRLDLTTWSIIDWTLSSRRRPRSTFQFGRFRSHLNFASFYDYALHSCILHMFS